MLRAATASHLWQYQMRHMGRSFQCVPLERLQRINQIAALSVSTWSEDSKHLCFYLVQFSLVLGCWPAWCGLLESSSKAPGKLQKVEWAIHDKLIDQFSDFVSSSVPFRGPKRMRLMRYLVGSTCSGLVGLGQVPAAPQIWAWLMECSKDLTVKRLNV